MSSADEEYWEEFAKKSGFGSAQEMAEYHKAYQNELMDMVKSGVSGTVPCRGCQSDAEWSRDGRSFSVKCGVCGWGAAGCIGEVPRSLN